MTSGVSPVTPIVLGVVLLVGTWFGRYKPPKWVLISLTLTSAFGISYGVLKCVRTFEHDLDVSTLVLLKHFETLCAGLVMGSLLTLAVSGELWKSCRSQELHADRTPEPRP